MSVSRAFRTRAVAQAETINSRKRHKHPGSNSAMSLAESAASDDEDPEDLRFLFSEDESAPSEGKRNPAELVML